jgi:hypothetical protein
MATNIRLPVWSIFCYLCVYAASKQLLRFIRENVQIEGIKAFHIIGFLRHNNRFSVGIRTGTGTKFTSYSQRKKRASTHWAGMTLILDALYGLGIINIIENKKHIQFVCRGKQRTKVAEQVKD